MWQLGGSGVGNGEGGGGCVVLKEAEREARGGAWEGGDSWRISRAKRKGI